jgi:glycosyltransferase involved in cell wall biosynthesis/SAM-dependent methyltransferase
LKLFILGLPHTQTLDPATSQQTTCAFTSKIWNLCRMLHRRGHEVIHLGVEGSTPECTEHVSVVTLADWAPLYGKRKPEEFYDCAADGPEKARYMGLYVARVKLAIAERTTTPWSAIVANTFGAGAQQAACQGLQQFVVESGIGYNWPWADFRVYESYAWMHFHLGREQQFAGDKWYHAVIPNAFDPSLFGPVEETKADYAVYLGRLNEDKGVRLACQVAQEVGMPIKLAGQGDPAPYLGPGVEYVGPVGAKDRRELLRHARVLFCPTRYVEPFGGVSIESAISGCPVICTDWGAYTENVIHGVTGYRCRTFEQFVWAARNIDTIKPAACRQWAEQNFSLDRIALLYEEYFQSVLRVQGTPEGWCSRDDSRTQLDWMRRVYPVGASSTLDLSLPPPSQLSPAPAPPSPPAPDYATEGKLGGYIVGGDEATYFPQLWDWFVDELKVKSVLDVGCGEGHALKHFRGRGCQVLGLDGMPQKDPDIVQVDFEATAYQPPHTFDLVWSCEFLEHVDEAKTSNMIPAFQAAPLVAVTHAFPGQGGHHHVNCRTPDYWIKFFADAGFTLDKDLTEKAREAAAFNKSPWNHFLRAGMVFRKVAHG